VSAAAGPRRARTVRLDHVLDGPAGDAGLNFAAQAGDDAARQRVVQAKRVADGVHALAHLQRGGGAEGQRLDGRGGRGDGEHGDVLVVVKAWRGSE